MKTIYLLAIGALAIAAGCNGKQSCDKNGACTAKGDKVEVYSGVMPAADCAGIRYTIKMDFDDDRNYTDGDYDMTQVYLQGDSTAIGGVADGKTFVSEGDFEVKTGMPGKPDVKYVVMTPDKKYAATAPTMYFVIDSDSTMTMVNADLTPSGTPELNYRVTRR